jgi:hypothetical protein
MTADDAPIIPDPAMRASAAAARAPFLERLLLTPMRDLVRGRITGRRTVRAAEIVPDLPISIRTLIDDVVRRTRLWRSEKRAVARELVAHFDDGLRAGRSSDQLIESFGNPLQAARLIRRAKKRLRPLPWQAMHRIKQAILLLIAFTILVYVVAAARLFLSSPTVSHDYLADLNAPLLAIPESIRAWPVYREALLALESLPSQKSAADALRPDDEGWTDAVAWLQRNEAALARLREAAMFPSLGYIPSTNHHTEDMPLWNRDAIEDGRAPSPVDQPQVAPSDDLLADSMMAVLLPHLSHLRKVSGILVTDAFRAAEESDGASMAADLRALFGIAGQVHETPYLISELVSIAILWRGFDALGELLTARPELFRDDDLVALAHELATLDGGGPFRLNYHGERMLMHDLVQRTYTDGGLGGGHLTPEGIRLLDMFGQRPGKVDSFTDYGEIGIAAIGPFYSVVAASRDNMLAKWDDLMDLTEAETALPLWQRGDSRIDAEIERIASAPVDSIRYRLLTALIPAISRASTSAEMTTQARDGLLVAIALRLHERRYGEFPGTVGELSPGLLPEVPLDRYDGGRLKYAFRDGVAIIYSAGVDRDDDGGVYIPYIESGRVYGRFLDQQARMWLSPRELERRSAVRPGQSRDPAEIQNGAVPDADWVLWMSESPATQGASPVE